MRAWVAGAMTLGLILACGGASLSSQEKWQSDNMERLGEFTFEDPAQQAALEAEMARIDAKYAELPDDNTRTELLRQLRLETEAVISEMDAAYLEELDVVLAHYKAAFVGTWEGGGVTLLITPDFNVDYEKKSGSTSTSINAPIQRFERDHFEVGMFGMNTSFMIEAPPAMDEAGTWHMTLDGVPLTKVY